MCSVKTSAWFYQCYFINNKQMKRWFHCKVKGKEAGLKEKKLFLRTFGTWLSFHLCLINFIVLSHWHLHPSRGRSCFKMKQGQDKTILLLEQVLISPQRGSTCKTLFFKELLGHSRTFVLHLHVSKTLWRQRKLVHYHPAYFYKVYQDLSSQYTSSDWNGFWSGRCLHRFKSKLFCALFNNATVSKQ